jgi:transposase
MIDATQAALVPLRADIERFGRRQAACKALVAAHYGVGPLTAVVVWAELGDCRRFSNSDDVVRHTGLDVTVDQSDAHRARGHLSRQGPGTLRWALFEAGMSASRATSPDRAYYQKVKAAHDGKLAAISMARKLARRCYHTLRQLDPDVVYAMPA